MTSSINSTVLYSTTMIRCEYCPRGFVESPNGLVEKTLHEILHAPEVVNK
ncbi:MAG TPA: hypothetical protein VD689_01085 [Nitrosopumilaceae archaeon]|nr:hypothetical protein [Nitrosopumilaceae archaeon]